MDFTKLGCGFLIVLSIIVGIVEGCYDFLVSCESDRYAEKFSEALDEGDLKGAKENLYKIEGYSQLKKNAVVLIREYTQVGEVKKASEIFEKVFTYSRESSSFTSDEFCAESAKLIRTSLLKSGNYEEAWRYYPLVTSNENHILNAQNRFAYLSDVVASLCIQGKQDDAQRFIEYNLRWFQNYVDSEESSESYKDEWNAYNSNAVRAKLESQIQNIY